jgi:putative tricarboxylic transport membrane protein
MRRLTAIAAAFLSIATATPGLAQTELKIMAPAAPGGGWDQTARAMQQALITTGLAKSVQVVNVPGAGGSVGLAQLINSAKGDGHQLMVNGLVMVGALLTNKSAVSLDQATPIARLTEEVEVIVVPASSPIKDAKELAAALKADPGKVRWTGGSAGGVDHITAALFAQAVGADPTKINYIPFSGGGESLAALLGARVTAGISGYGEYEGQIKAGKLRVVGITADKRVDGVEAPTLKEQGIDLVIANWRSVMAPPGLSPQQRDDLIALVEKMAKTPAWKNALKQKGWDDALLTGDAFASFLKREQERVAAILESAGMVKP